MSAGAPAAATAAADLKTIVIDTGADQKQKQKAREEFRLSKPQFGTIAKAEDSEIQTCSEDVDDQFRPPEFKEFEAATLCRAQPPVSFSEKQSWRRLITDAGWYKKKIVSATLFDDNPLNLLFPMSGIVYRNRLRKACVEVEFKGSASTPSSGIVVHMTSKQIESALLRCLVCPHRVVPLRIAVAEYESKGLPDTRLSLQLRTAYFEAMDDRYSHLVSDTHYNKHIRECMKQRDHKSPKYNYWVQDTTTLFTETDGSFKPDAESDLYGFALRPNAYAHTPVPVYQARAAFTIGNNYDILRALSFRSNKGLGPDKFILTPSDPEQQQTALVRQPSDSNEAPDVISYIVTSHIPRRENGLSTNSLVSFSAPEEKTKLPFWKYPAADVYKILDGYASRLSRYNMVMNLSDGLRVSFRPLGAWAPKGDFSVRVKMEFYYITINC